MAFSAGFHIALFVLMFLLTTNPPGDSNGLVEIRLADAEALGDPNAELLEGMPADSDRDPQAVAEQAYDPQLEEQIERVKDSIDALSEQQRAEIEQQQRESAASTSREDANRVKGIRSSDAVVGGSLSDRAGIGKLEPRTFYGMKVHSRRMIFVLDISGSMNIPYAKLNLRNAYTTLSSREQFALVCYDHQVYFWPPQKRLVAATNDTRQEADVWVDALRGGGSTNIYDALKMAFEICVGGDHADTIYFLSDGFPTSGQTTQAHEILQAVAQWNRNNQVVINTIGIGQHDIELMSSLAAAHRGVYRALR
jgi:Mg-chelatase subunit ChlD